MASNAATGKSSIIKGPGQLRTGGIIDANKLKSLTVNNVVEVKNMILAGSQGQIKAGIVIDVDATGVRASRFALAGPINVGSRISMERLYGLDPNLKLQLDLNKDASIFVFPSDGDCRNYSQWIDVQNYFSPTAINGSKPLTWDDLLVKYPEVNFDCSVRAYILHEARMGKAIFGLQAVPLSSERIEELVEGGKPMESWACPHMHVPVGVGAGGSAKNGRDIEFSMLEEKEDCFGVGILPVLLTLGLAEDAVFPTVKQIRNEVWALMGKMRGFPNRLPSGTKNVLEAVMSDWGVPEREKLPKFVWPDIPDQNPNSTVGKSTRTKFFSLLRCRTVLGNHKLIARSKLKYSIRGDFNKNSFPGVDKRFIRVLVESANASLASSTWNNYRCATRHVEKMNSTWGTRVRYPFTREDTWNFIAYLLKRNMKASTIKSYLAAIRHKHHEEGFDAGSLSNRMIDMILRGRENLDNQNEDNMHRLPITKERLIMIKEYLKSNVSCKEDKAMLWCIAVWLWWGSFRGGEILCNNCSTFDPSRTLLAMDVSPKSVVIEGAATDVLIVNLKSPKESRGKQIKVELMGNQGRTCPIRAFNTWVRIRHRRMVGAKPLFTRKNGTPVTTSDMNLLLKRVFPELKSSFYISLHSFRAGLATEMARTGYSDTEIQRQGRWHSDAFLKYIKMGRAERWANQKALSRAMSC